MEVSVESLERRYEYIRDLGSGAMGRVRLVHDEVRGHAVAQKHVNDGAAAASLHFKREFRELSRLLHPNLVRVYELGQDAEGLFFIMEAIDGVPLDEYCTGKDLLSTLRHLLPQILDALVFIHAHGVVHRDLKPNNVLVTREGVVKLLDFGVLGRFTKEGGEQDRFVVVGTPGYMAPEQIQGRPPQPASDLYALGCMLFELLSGAPVFVGSQSGVLRAHLCDAPPRLSQIAPSVPPLFDVICHELLDKDPEKRPTAEKLVRRLLDPLGVSLSLPSRPPAVLGDLIGRDALVESVLSELSHESGASIVALSGPTGVGKSAVVERIARELERGGRLVLRGRARPSERVAYNALDGAIDDLARMLARREGGDAAVQEAAEVARRVFPVLAASGFATNDRVKELVRFRLFGGGPALSRSAVFEALHQLMRRAAGPNGRIVILIDDFQWADEDSLALLSHFEDAELDAPTVIVSLRDDLGGSAADRWLLDRARVQRIEVPPLEPEAVSEIVRRTARARGIEPSASLLARAAAACDGRPLLAELAGRALATTGNSDLMHSIRKRSDNDRQLLALLVACDAWTPAPMLARVTGLSLGKLDDAVASLERDGLVRRGGRGTIEGVVDLYHDVVRRAAAGALPEHIARAHALLADHWLAIPDAPPERRVRHLIGAGRHAEAAEHAVAAALHAEDQRAFGLAADMYAIALEAPRRNPEPLMDSRAKALEQVGRYLDAASVWRRLSTRSRRERRLDLALCEAHALIAANRVDAGLNRLDSALCEAGDLPSHSRSPRAMLSSYSFALGPAGRHVRRVIRIGQPRAGSASARRDVRIGILLAFLDPMSGLRYLLRARDRFADAGERTSEAQIEYMFAVLALVGEKAQRVPLAERYIARAERLLGPGPRPLEALAMAEFVSGLRDLRHGNWARGQAALAHAGETFEKVGAVAERLLAASWSTMADAYRQNVPALRAHISWFRQHLDELGGGIVTAHVELMEGYLRYLEGDFDACRAAVDRIVTMYRGRRPNVQLGGALLYRHMADLYADHRSAPRRQFLASMREVRQFRLFETMYAGPYAMIGALLEAGALRRGTPGASRKRLEWFARRIDDAPPLVAGASYRARAYVSDDPERAIELLETAETIARRFDRNVDAAIARFQRGKRLGGAHGSELVSAAQREIAELGASQLLLHEDPGR